MVDGDLIWGNIYPYVTISSWQALPCELVLYQIFLSYTRYVADTEEFVSLWGSPLSKSLLVCEIRVSCCSYSMYISSLPPEYPPTLTNVSTVDLFVREFDILSICAGKIV